MLLWHFYMQITFIKLHSMEFLRQIFNETKQKLQKSELKVFIHLSPCIPTPGNALLQPNFKDDQLTGVNAPRAAITNTIYT